MSDTPRTDAKEYDWNEDCTHEEGEEMIVSASFARKLERENNELAEALERIATSGYDDAFHAIEHCQQIAADALAKRKEAK